MLWRLSTSDNRENRDKSSIVTRAASKRFVDKMDGPSALGKRAGDALKQDGVLQPAFGSPSIPASTPEDLAPQTDIQCLVAGLCPSRQASVRQPSSGSSQGSSCARCMAKIRASSLPSRQGTGHSRDHRQTGQESVARSATARPSDRVGRMLVDEPDW